MSCCRRRRGTRSTTSTPRTCTPSSTRSTRRSARRGRPARTGTSSQTIAEAFAPLGAKHLGVRKDLVAVPLLHDTPDAMATPHGRVLDWRKGECEPVPGKTMPKLVVVERDFGAVFDQMGALGPLMDTWAPRRRACPTTSSARWSTCGTRTARCVVGQPPAGPRSRTRRHVAETIMALSGTTNGHLATQGFKTLEKRTGQLMHDLAAEHEGKQITFADTQAAPVPVITSPEWSGSESGRPPLLTLHDQRRAAQAVAHPHRDASTSTSTTTGCRSSVRACRSTSRRWT